MKILDTQVVSLAFKGSEKATLMGASITSIVGNEFLLVQTENPVQARYYVPHPAIMPNHPTFLAMDPAPRDHAFSRRATDQLLMSFGGKFPDIIEYGNFALSRIVAERLAPLYTHAISHLPKSERKYLLSHFNFLLDHSLGCVPLVKPATDIALDLLQRFVMKHNLKKDFRNSWNDMLILAAAIQTGSELITLDNELSRFAAEVYDGEINRSGSLLSLQFKADEVPALRPTGGTKGFINNGWQVRFRNLKNEAYRSGRNRQ